MDAYFPLSILLSDDASTEDIQNHLRQQQAIADLIEQSIDADEFLQIFESTGIDIDEYAAEVLPIIDTGTRRDLIWIPE